MLSARLRIDNTASDAELAAGDYIHEAYLGIA